MCSQRSLSHILRGLQTVGGFDLKIKMGLANTKLDSSVEAVYLLPSENFISVSSSAARGILLFGCGEGVFQVYAQGHFGKY